MPSQLHELLIEMFRDRPALAADLLSGPLGVAVPEFQRAQLSAGELTDVAPTEYRADAVVTLNVANDPIFAVVVEVQLRVDLRKRRTWPAYVATLHARLGCPAILLVVCSNSTVATWCAERIVITDPGLTLTPVVLGPQQVPVVTDAAMARRHPQLAVLSAVAHGGRVDRPPVFGPLLAALDIIDHEQANLYIELVFTALPTAARALLEDLMTTAAQRHESEFARHFMGKAKAEWRAEGKAEGKAEGEAEGEARALLAILDARHIQVPDTVRADILACTDTAQLEAWIRRAATAEKIQDVVG
jgi:hypothetical protein